ncbi:DASH family cryptochrome [Exiguobacterium flavidum]|uniref:DASH family cryptochrome n=1 Tax=Exiguobacterium flavidum TaxID=2184695 RepID=UPI001E592E61|nr:DASH family cryptochrome [Exiguobacterium flavidum]
MRKFNGGVVNVKGIVWFRSDLRVDDHEALQAACRTYDEVIAIYAAPESRMNRLFEPGKERLEFQRETLDELQYNLGQLSIPLIRVTGDAAEWIGKHYEKGDVVYFHRMTGVEERHLERKVREDFESRVFETQTLHAGMLKDGQGFSGFRKNAERTVVPVALDPPGHIVYREVPNRKEGISSKSAFPFTGGEAAGRGRIAEYMKDDIFRYKETRNGFQVDDSSKFSAWLANGSLSPRRVMQELKMAETLRGGNASTYWMYVELLWRDYFHHKMRSTGNGLFRSNGLLEEKRNWSVDWSVIERWIEGRTGQPFVDAFMREFAETGWMSNRGRQITASYLVHDLGQDWRIGAEYFESRLVDYDVASNYGNWAYIAGVLHPGGAKRFDPVWQQERYDPEEKFIRKWGI